MAAQHPRPHLVPSHPEILSLRQAAAIASKSVSWVRTHRSFGPLLPAELNGRQAVEAASLFCMLERRAPAKRARRRPHLYVVSRNDV